MIRLLLLCCCVTWTMTASATTILVKNITELNAANKSAKPGDIIVLANGAWDNVTIQLTCQGTEKQPIIFRAQSAGKVNITGQSSLKIGGTYITVDGLHFNNGFSGKNVAVIDFKVNKQQVANYCRVTNTVIDNFNNPKRMDDNNWVSFSGQHNRLDHCSFRDKNNMGVLLAVLLDDERSRTNFHSIDHNYFGRRIPLGSNGGEMIRVGVSQHCQFNSNTQITDNFFDQCDGETEIVSIKSGENVIRGNMFKESQGSVVLRHGDNNTVENNVFLGKGKEGTGGVRVINKGQWVVNNLFYGCRGLDFRSPLAVMNGIPNSPAHRYVQVTDAVIANNTFVNCANISFGEGSDTERSLPPAGVLFANNLFYNDRDSIIYKVFDDITGIRFLDNEVSASVRQPLADGFSKAMISTQKNDNMPFPVATPKQTSSFPVPVIQQARQRLKRPLSPVVGFSDLALVKRIQANAYTSCGAVWFKKANPAPVVFTSVKCATSAEVHKQLASKQPVHIELTGSVYELDKPFVISKPVQFSADRKNQIAFSTGPQQSVFLLAGNGHLNLRHLTIDGSNVKANHFISNDSTGPTAHYNLVMTNCSVSGLSSDNGCTDLFFAYKHFFADSIIIRNNMFTDNKVNGFMMNAELDNKGYYAAEKIQIGHNHFINNKGVLLDVYRGGNDESTMGPNLTFSHNKVTSGETMGDDPLIRLTGVQVSQLFSNQFTKTNTDKTLLHYSDAVRARHIFEKNTLSGSGNIIKNKYVAESDNTIQ